VEKRLAYARQGKWADAREKFKNVEFAVTSLPVELQRIVISEAMRFLARGQGLLRGGQTLQRSRCRRPSVRAKPAISVLLRGRLAEALGHDKDALDNYRICRGIIRSGRSDRSQAARNRAAAEEERDESARPKCCANWKRFR